MANLPDLQQPSITAVLVGALYALVRLLNRSFDEKRNRESPVSLVDEETERRIKAMEVELFPEYPRGSTLKERLVVLERALAHSRRNNV